MKFYTDSELGKTRRLTPEGFLVVEAVPIARLGEMDYHGSEVSGVDAGTDGMVKMSRTADELFSADTLASFEGKPIIIPTGDVHTSGVDSDTWADHAVGHIQGVRASGQFIVADLIINDSNAIERVNNGLRELSCGYEYMARQTEPGHGEQYEIRGNHVALVDKARGGNQLKIGDKAKSMSKSKNPWLRLFAHAVKAGDEEAQKDIEEKMDKEETAGDEVDASVAKIEALEAKLDKLIDVVSALTSKAGDELGDDKDDSDDAEKAGDAEWQEVIAGAAIVAPELTIERKGSIGDAMSKVLAKSESNVAKKFAGDSINPQALAILFASVVDAKKAENNAKTFTGDSYANPQTFSGLDNGGFEIMGR